MTSTFGKLRNRAPVPYAPRVPSRLSQLISGGRGGMTSQMEAYGSIGTVFSIVRTLYVATARVEWHLYRKQVDGRRVTPMPDSTDPRSEITRHAALDVWNRPNPFMTGKYFRQCIQQHKDLVGEYIIVVVRAPGLDLPLELWPVRPDRMTPIPHPTEFLAGWIYTGPNGEKIPLGVDEVIQDKYPNPLDPYRGLGPIQAALVDIDSARYSAEWNRNFFRNSAEPGGVIELDDDLTDEEFETFQKRWRDSHQGVGNAHRVALLENGAKWKATQFTPKDMQFSELRGVSRELIREAFAMHGHMLGISQDVNKANAEAGESSFARWLAVPRVDDIKDVLNFRLLPMFKAETVEFDHDRVVPEDREADDRERTSRANAVAALVGTGRYDPAGALEAFGLPPIDTIDAPATPAPQLPASAR